MYFEGEMGRQDEIGGFPDTGPCASYPRPHFLWTMMHFTKQNTWRHSLHSTYHANHSNASHFASQYIANPEI